MFGGTLISPRHVAYSAHAQQFGGYIRFVTMDNQVITRTVSNTTSLSGFGISGSVYPDIAIGVLDSDVPSSIGFAKILPSGWNSKIPSLYKKDLPILALDKEKKALIQSLYSLTTRSGVNGALAQTRPPAEFQRKVFYEPTINGDSSSPFFLIINNQLVLVTTASYNGGTNYQYYKNEINSLMTTLGGGYQLTEIDLSSFPSY